MNLNNAIDLAILLIGGAAYILAHSMIPRKDRNILNLLNFSFSRELPLSMVILRFAPVVVALALLVIFLMNKEGPGKLNFVSFFLMISLVQLSSYIVLKVTKT